MKKYLVIGFGLMMIMVSNLCACSFNFAIGDDAKKENYTSQAEDITKSEDQISDISLENTVVTAEDLIQNYANNIQSVSGNLSMVLNTQTESYENLVVALEAVTQVDQSVSHIAGTIDVDISDTHLSVPMNSYEDMVHGKCYSSEYDETTNETTWYVSSGNPTVSSYSIEHGLAEGITNLTLSEVNNTYIVNGQVPLGNIILDLSGITGIDTSNSSEVCYVTLTFDKNTKLLTKYDYDMSDAYTKIINTATTCKLCGTLYDHNSTVVTIPASVNGSANTDTVTDGIISTTELENQNLATQVFGITNVTVDDVIQGMLYQYPLVGADYIYGTDVEIDGVLISLQGYLNFYTEDELVKYLDSASYTDKNSVAALLLIGDLYAISSNYSYALDSMLDAVYTNQIVHDGYNLYVKICGME